MLMEILFAFVLLVLLLLGWRNYRKERSQWLREERYEESGNWLDKRAQERGTYGSLDQEMEEQRRNHRTQAARTELQEMVWMHLLDNSPTLPDAPQAQLIEVKSTLRAWASDVVNMTECLLHHQDQPPEKIAIPHSEALLALKKKVMDFLFDFYPALLGLEIEEIKTLDEAICSTIHNLLYRLEPQPTSKKV